MADSIPVFILLGAVMVANLGIALPITKKVYEELRDVHPAIWEEFGSPSLFSIKSSSQERSWWAFVMFRKYRGLNSRYLTRLGDALFGCMIANLAVIAIWIFAYGGLVFSFKQ